MNCGEFEARFEALLEGRLADPDRAVAEAHAAGCPACQELLGLARSSAFGGDATSAGAEAPDLVPAVLAQTGHATGACGRARDLLAAASAGESEHRAPSEALDNLLLAQHLAGCPDCRAMQGVFSALGRDLPGLAEVAPDAGFVARVLRRTLPVEVQVRRFWDAFWPQLWHRPRFASEAAYVGLATLVLVFTTPGSPLAALPSAAWQTAEDAPLPRIELPAIDLAPRLAEAKAQLRAAAGETVELTIEVRCRLGTFWQEAASLLETGNDRFRSRASAPTTTESAPPEETK